MKVYEIHAKPGLEALTLTERPDPIPGPGQVLLKMRAASLNYRDLLVLKGSAGSAAPPTPVIPLSDGLGKSSVWARVSRG